MTPAPWAAPATGAGARLKEKAKEEARLNAETPRQTLLRVAAQKAHAVAFKLQMFEVRLDRGNRVYQDQVDDLKAQYMDAVQAVARAAKEPNLSGAARASLDRSAQEQKTARFQKQFRKKGAPEPEKPPRLDAEEVFRLVDVDGSGSIFWRSL